MGWFWLSPQEEIYWQRLKTGERADITLAPMKEIYLTHIERVEEDKLWLRGFSLDSLIEIKPNIRINVSAYTEEGILRFKSKVISWNPESGSFSIKKPTSIERIQRRQYYRLNIILPVRYAILPADRRLREFDTGIILNLSGVTRNISEGGMLLVTDRLLSIGTLLKVQVNLDTKTSVEVIAAVSKVVEKRNLEVNKYAIHLEFVRIDEDAQEKIRRFILINTRRPRE